MHLYYFLICFGPLLFGEMLFLHDNKHRREKVKRRRAQKGKESTETPSEVLPDRNQQPDLDELSRDLPSGWQVNVYCFPALVTYFAELVENTV